MDEGAEVFVDLDFSNWQRQLRNLKPVMQDVAEEIKLRIEDEFDSEGRGRWPDLMESTVVVRGKGAKILQRSAVLAGSIAPEATADFAEAFVSNVPYGKFHVTGTKYMEKRDFTDIDLDSLTEFASDLILDEMVR